MMKHEFKRVNNKIFSKGELLPRKSTGMGMSPLLEMEEILRRQKTSRFYCRVGEDISKTGW